MKTEIAELDQASEEFRKWMFPELRYWLRLAERPTDYKLGVVSYARNPYFFLVVYTDSFAHKIGFRGGDTIRSIAGKDLAGTLDLETVKIVIKENLGKKIEAVVERNGKIEKIKLKIPKEIPAEAIYK
jgi:S1-C subfamily serine protease